jgi:hypothetical protein
MFSEVTRTNYALPFLAGAAILALCASAAAFADDGPQILPAHTPFTMRLTESLSSNGTNPGASFVFVNDDPIGLGARIVIPQGMTGVGKVIAVSRGGRGHAGSLTLRVDALQLNDGRTLKFTDQVVHINAQSGKVNQVSGLIVKDGDVRVDPTAVIHTMTKRAVTTV